MNAQDYKRTMQMVFAELANGNGRPFVDAMRDDFATKYRNTATCFIAEGDTVVVECKGDVVTTRGDRYDNNYCYVCRFAEDGKLIALTEYMDTALAERVLVPPA